MFIWTVILFLQVRAAATLGGNLVLTRDRGLESDAATLLAAAGAEVQVCYKSGNRAATPAAARYLPRAFMAAFQILL